MKINEVRKAAEGYCDNDGKRRLIYRSGAVLINSLFQLSLKGQIGE